MSETPTSEANRLKLYQAYWQVLRAMATGKAILRVALLLFTVFGPPVYLWKDPAAYTPLVQVLIGVFLFLLAYWMGYEKEVERAAKRANDRWLPQAESVVLRLMTLRANVTRFSCLTKRSCSASACDLPELEKDDMKAVRIKMKTECEASSQRLDDIAHQLEDAIEDWRRFITANCQGEECARIFDALQQREERIRQDLGKNTSAPESMIRQNAEP
jgi:hypothetical protein